jgi:ribosome-associated heat shock protein Hsp15
MVAPTAARDRQRIDKWLFFSRAVKSRSLAAKLVVAGRVRINRDKAAQASDLVKPGDVLTITLERRIFVWKVLGTGVRRGPAEEARTLYEDMSPLPALKGEAPPDAIPALREAGSGRPTKKERRQTDRLHGED